METQANTVTPVMAEEYIGSMESMAIDWMARYWRQADLPPCYPADTETVAELMDANGYRSDREAILRMIAEKAVPSPARLNGRLIWRAIDIKMLITACEIRRRWKPFSKFHAHKLTQYEKLQELASLNGGQSCFSDLLFFDWSGMVAMLHEPGMADLGAREALAAALSEKLRAIGIDI